MNDADFSSGETFAKSLTPDLFGFLFAVPALFGLGNHWYLSDEEEKELSESGWLAVSALPKNNRKNFEKWVSQYLPFIMFALVAGTIIGRRVATTMTVLRQRKPKAKVLPLNRGEQSNEQSNDPANREETDEGSNPNISTKRVLSDPFSQAFGGIASGD